MDITVNVTCAGLCGSDIIRLEQHSGHGAVLGHEFVGVIADGNELDPQETFCAGDKVAVLPIIYNKAKFPECLMSSLGKDRDGGFSPQVKVPSENLYRLPDDASLEEYALLDVLACAMHAYNMAGKPRGKRVVVLGDGAIGLCCALVCRENGNNVVVVGRHQRHVAEAFGCEFSDNDGLYPPESFDVAIEAVGREQSQSLNLAIDLISARGIIVVEGVFVEGFVASLAVRKLFAKEGGIVGVNSYERWEFENALRLMLSGRVSLKPLITHRLPMSQFERGVKLMRSKAQSKAIRVLYFHEHI